MKNDIREKWKFIEQGKNNIFLQCDIVFVMQGGKKEGQLKLRQGVAVWSPASVSDVSGECCCRGIKA